MDTKGIISFLKRLKNNNNKQWMDENRSEYHECRDYFKTLTQSLINEVQKFDMSIENLALKDCVYRINRNNRFKKDAPPYKDYFAATISNGGKKSSFAEYYFHISPDGKSCVGGGLWGPTPEQLAKVRQEIDYNPQPLQDFFNNKKVQSFFSDFYDFGRVKTAPRGYTTDHPHIHWIRNKHFAVFVDLKDDFVKNEANFKKKTIDVFKTIHPLVTYLNEAVSEQ